MRPKVESEAPPIVVVVTGPPGTRAEVTARLTGRLFRRGFRVRTLQVSREKFSEDGDFALVPCEIKKVERLAKRLEEEWTERWLTWYTIQNRFPRVARKSTSRCTRLRS